MLRDMAPRTKHVAFLRNLDNPILPKLFTAVEREARGWTSRSMRSPYVPRPNSIPPFG